jgi:hypothetical protein
MTEFERFAATLALTESADSEVAWGDPKELHEKAQMMVAGVLSQVPGAQFMAMGRWQMHPAWYAEWADPAMQVGWSWDTAFRAALHRFWNEMVMLKLQPVDAAMVFHLGESAYHRGERDEAYAKRFEGFWHAKTEES